MPRANTTRTQAIADGVGLTPQTAAWGPLPDAGPRGLATVRVWAATRVGGAGSTLDVLVEAGFDGATWTPITGTTSASWGGTAVELTVPTGPFPHLRVKVVPNGGTPTYYDWYHQINYAY